MKETIYERAVMSAFKSQLDRGIPEPTTQLKAIERRVRALSLRDEEESPSFDSLIGVLSQGLCIRLGDQQFIAKLDELQLKADGGLIKWLNANVDKKTKNPKTSRGTVWRRNSTVKERRRLSPNWKEGSTARMEAKRKSKVMLTPYDVWLEKVEALKNSERQVERDEIQGKRALRSYKAELEREMKRRVEAGLSVEEVVASDFIAKVRSLCEKNGLANETEFYRRTLDSIINNQPLPLIFVWGPPYEGQGEDTQLFERDTPEKNMADQIEDVIVEVGAMGVKLQPLLLFADVYGLEVNGMDPSVIQTYLESLEKRFQGKAEVLKWSTIRVENNDRYQELAASLETSGFDISEESMRNATLVQAKLGNSINSVVARELASRYKRERLVEGQILTEGFWLSGIEVRNVIKLGTAPSRFKNDEPYETTLPRFYIKNMTRAAWNKPRK